MRVKRKLWSFERNKNNKKNANTDNKTKYIRFALFKQSVNVYGNELHAKNKAKKKHNERECDINKLQAVTYK